MPGGRPAKPTELKKAQGTLRKHRQNKREPSLKLAVPPIPDSLEGNPVASSEWRQLCKELLAYRVITEQDRAIIESAALAYAEYMEACGDIKANGGTTYTTEATNGAPVIKAHPAVAIRADAWRRRKSAICELGLTPAARTKLQTIQDEEQESPAAGYFN